jgi:hypothetical protein
MFSWAGQERIALRLCRITRAILDTIMRPGEAGCIRIPGAALSLSDFFPALLLFSIHSICSGMKTRDQEWVLLSDVTDFWHFLRLGLGSGGDGANSSAARGPSKLPLISNQTRTRRWPHGQFAPFQAAAICARNTLIYANIARTKMLN